MRRLTSGGHGYPDLREPCLRIFGNLGAPGIRLTDLATRAPAEPGHSLRIEPTCKNESLCTKLDAITVLTGLLLPRPRVPPKGPWWVLAGHLPLPARRVSDEQNSSRERESVATDWHPRFQKGWN
jgi:hypothetical protein